LSEFDLFMTSFVNSTIQYNSQRMILTQLYHRLSALW